MIKVLIVEDSEVVRELIRYILNSDPRIAVVGTAANGEEALDFLSTGAADVITMDISMPKMDGLEAIRRIMSTKPVPIIIVSSSWDPHDLDASFQAMEVGAVAIAEKPWGINHPDYNETASKLIESIKLMSEVKVIRRWLTAPTPDTPLSRPDSFKGSKPKENPGDDNPLPLKGRAARNLRVLAIGVSTGGPPVLQNLLSALPKHFPLPVLIVQHISAGFLPGFVQWLNQTSALPVKIGEHYDSLLPGHVYIAPDNFQMRVSPDEKIILSRDEVESKIMPSVSYLFKSIAEIYGKNSIGMLLTGMGSDGADELLLMKEKGAVTIAQDKESCVVYGMPAEAIKRGAARYILSPEKIISFLAGLVLNDQSF